LLIGALTGAASFAAKDATVLHFAVMALVSAVGLGIIIAAIAFRERLITRFITGTHYITMVDFDGLGDNNKIYGRRKIMGDADGENMPWGTALNRVMHLTEEEDGIRIEGARQSDERVIYHRWVDSEDRLIGQLDTIREGVRTAQADFGLLIIEDQYPSETKRKRIEDIIGDRALAIEEHRHGYNILVKDGMNKDFQAIRNDINQALDQAHFLSHLRAKVSDINKGQLLPVTVTMATINVSQLWWRNHPS